VGAGRFAIYVVEFYWASADGSREEVARQWQRAQSQEVIEARARAMIKNVLLDGRRANLCVVKDPSGTTLSRVVGGSRRDRAKTARRSANADAPVIPSS